MRWRLHGSLSALFWFPGRKKALSEEELRNVKHTGEPGKAGLMMQLMPIRG